MKTPKKASVKAQAFASKLTGSEVAKSTTWADITDIINDHFPYVYDMHTKCKAQGDNTIIKLYKGDENATKDDIIETFSLPNSEVFIEKEGDWEWPVVHKLIVEYFMKNWKKLTSGKKFKAKKQAPVDANTLMKRVAELRELISKSKGSEKKKLIKEYNEKSVLLDKILEENAAKAKEVKEERKASADDLKKLRNRKMNLSQKIKKWDAEGKDTTELKTQLAQLTAQLTEAKTGVKK